MAEVLVIHYQAYGEALLIIQMYSSKDHDSTRWVCMYRNTLPIIHRNVKQTIRCSVGSDAMRRCCIVEGWVDAGVSVIDNQVTAVAGGGATPSHLANAVWQAGYSD